MARTKASAALSAARKSTTRTKSAEGVKKPPGAGPGIPVANSRLVSYYNNATFSDITLRAQETEVLAHKVVLAANSPSLEAMLHSEMQEGSASEITLHEMAGPVLTLMISHMYGTLSRIPDKELPALFMAADAHQVPDLRHRCLSKMLADIDDTNILEFVQAADSVSDTKLMEACLKCWKAPGFSPKVIETPAMLTLMQEKPFLAQKLMLASASAIPKRKADQIS